MRIFSTLLVVAILLLSSVPTSVAQTTTSSIYPTVSTTTTPTVACQRAGLTQADAEKLRENVYYTGHQTTNTITDTDPDTLEEAAEKPVEADKQDFLKRAFPNMDEALKDKDLTKEKIKAATKEELIAMCEERGLRTEGDEDTLRQRMLNYLTEYSALEYEDHQPVPGATGMEVSYNFWGGCGSCDNFPLETATDVYQLAVVKDTSTKVQYCEGDATECRESVADAEEAEEEGGIFTTNDLLLSINSLEYNEVNGYWSPASFDTMLYSSSQKAYNNFMPLAFAISLAVPFPTKLLSVFKNIPLNAQIKTLQAQKWFSNSALGRLAGYKSATGASSQLDDLVLYQRFKYVKAGQGSKITTFSEKTQNALRGPLNNDALNVLTATSDEIFTGVTGSMDDAVKALAAQSTVVDDDLLKILQNELGDKLVKSVDDISPSSINSAMGSLSSKASAKGGDKFAAAELERLQQLASQRATVGMEKALVERNLLEAIQQGRIPSNSQNLLQSLGYDPTIAQRIVTATDPVEIQTLLAAVPSTQAANLATFDAAINAMKSSGTITATQEGLTKKLVRSMVGAPTTGKQMVMTGLIRVGIYFTAQSVPSRSTTQFIMTAGDEATEQGNIQEYLDGEAPYLMIMSNSESFLGGFTRLMAWAQGYLGPLLTPITTWLSNMQWRWGGEADRDSEVPDAIQFTCEYDGNRVGDTIWIFGQFTQEDKKRTVYYDNPMDIYFNGGSLIVDSTGLDGKGTTDSFITELENPRDGCMPTLLTYTHGLDLSEQIWKGDSAALNWVEDFMNSIMGKGSPAGGKENSADGILFSDYLTVDEEDRCSNLQVSLGLISQSLPISSLIFAPYFSRELSQCTDTDYWVHFTPNEEQTGISDILPDLASDETASITAVTPTGEAIFEVEEPQRAGQEMETETIEYETDMPTDTIDTTTSYEAKGTVLEDVLADLGIESQSAEEILETLSSAAEEKIEDISIESKLKEVNAKTLWLHGEHPQGVYAGLEVQSCCFMVLSGKTEYSSTGYEDAKPAAMVSQEKPDSNVAPQVVVVNPDTNTIEVLRRNNVTGALEQAMKIISDLSTHMHESTVEGGRVIPYEGKTVTYTKSDEVLFGSEIVAGFDSGYLVGGAYGYDDGVTTVIDCLVDYIDSLLGKTYMHVDYDRALSELGKIKAIYLEDGLMIKNEVNAFVVSGTGVVSPAQTVEIKANEEVYADGVKIGEIKSVHTENAQLMWDKEGGRILMWISKMAGGVGTEFSPATDTDQDGLSDEQEAEIGTSPTDDDTDGDGVTDGQEISNGTDPLDPDSDDDGILDGQEDSDGDGIADAEECNFNGLALDLGSELTNALTLIGPIMSFETNETEVTFIADYDDLGNCKKYVRKCSRVTGQCSDPEEISSYSVQDSIVEITLADGGKELLEFSMSNGQPMLKSTTFDESGQVVEGPETFESQPVEKVRGTTGVGIYDPESGEWTFYNGFDIPSTPEYSNGATITNSPVFNTGSMLPYTPYDRPEEETISTTQSLAELPWAPPEYLSFLLFTSFLLMATLFIRKKRGKNGP